VTGPVRANYAQSYFNEGEKLLQERNDRQAIIEYKKAIYLQEKSDYLFALGEVYFLNQNYSQAEYYFKKTIKKDANNAQALFGLSENYFVQQKYDQALSTIEGKNSADLLLKIQLARIYLSQEQDDKAENAIKSQTDNLAKFYQAKILLYQQQLETAINKLSEVEKKAGDQKRTMLIAEPGESDIQIIKDAISQSKKTANDATRKVIFGESLNQTGDAACALSILKRVAEGDPTYRDAYVFLGHSYILVRNFEAAKDALLKAKELDPIYYPTWMYLAQAYEGLGNSELAKTCADKAEKLK